MIAIEGRREGGARHSCRVPSAVRLTERVTALDDQKVAGSDDVKSDFLLACLMQNSSRSMKFLASL